MPYDPAWSQPEINWQQQGSFIEPATPPALGPLEGTLIQMPCINRDWLPIVLGALDQLRNPSSWLASLTDAQRYDVLGDADVLRSAIGQALTAATPCMPIALRLNNCVLQYSQDGGSTWVDTTGWDTWPCDCSVACTIPPVPGNPSGVVPQQLACNIAGFLAMEVIQRTTEVAITFAQSAAEAANFATQLAGEFTYLFPVLHDAIEALNAYFQEYVLGVLAHFEFAATDPTLWSSVTCAIYSAIQQSNYVTAGNISAVIANVCSISYLYSDVKTAICAFISNIGLRNLQQMQSAGAIEDVDCEACPTPWCQYFDFTAGDGGWVQEPGGAGLWENGYAGNAWYAQIVSPSEIALHFYKALPHESIVTSVDIWVVSPDPNSGGHTRATYNQDPCNTTTVSSEPWPNGTYSTVTKLSSGPLGGIGSCVKIYWDSDNVSPDSPYIVAAAIHGTGVNPFGNDNCPP